jgi:PAS domain S-box-containing protein
MILLVEDEVLIAMGEQMLLQEAGYQVLIADSGEAAIEAVTTHPEIDLILMDIDLGPGMDGTEAAAVILRDRDLPVVFLSSHTEPDVVEKTEKITSYGYIVKNTGHTVLQASIKMAFKLFAARQSEKAKEKALYESEQRFRQLFEQNAVGIGQVSLDNRIIDANEAYCRMLGMSKEVLVGKSLSEITHPEVLAENLRYQQQLSTGISDHYRMEKRFIHADGHTVHGILNASLVRNNEGMPSYIIGSVLDITERKRTEAALADSEAYNRSIIEAMPDIIVLTNTEGEYLDVIASSGNRPLLVRDDLLGKKVTDVLPEKPAKRVMDSIRNVLRTKALRVVEYELVVPAGKRFFEARIVPLGDVKALVLIRDITDQK